MLGVWCPADRTYSSTLLTVQYLHALRLVRKKPGAFFVSCHCLTAGTPSKPTHSPWIALFIAWSCEHSPPSAHDHTLNYREWSPSPAPPWYLTCWNLFLEAAQSVLSVLNSGNNNTYAIYDSWKMHLEKNIVERMDLISNLRVSDVVPQ